MVLEKQKLTMFFALCIKFFFFFIINQSSLYLQCILSLIMLCTGDIFVLITYCSIVESFFIMISIAGILWLRYKRPNMKRPIKVMYFICIKLINYLYTHMYTYIENFSFQIPLWIPILFVALCAFLVIVPCYERPYEVGMGILITASGIPAYFFGIAWKSKPLWFQKLNSS